MQIREQTSIPPTAPSYFRAMVQEAIRELDADYQAGEVDHASYYHRRHALERMLR